MVQLLFNITVMFRVEIILLWILTSCIFGVYLKSTGHPKWYLGCIPYVNIGLRIPMKVFNIATAIVFAWCITATLIWGFSYLTIVAIVLKVYTDSRFAFYYMDCNRWIYSLVPFARYYLMFKEARNERVQSG